MVLRISDASHTKYVKIIIRAKLAKVPGNAPLLCVQHERTSVYRYVENRGGTYDTRPSHRSMYTYYTIEIKARIRLTTLLLRPGTSSTFCCSEGSPAAVSMSSRISQLPVCSSVLHRLWIATH